MFYFAEDQKAVFGCDEVDLAKAAVVIGYNKAIASLLQPPAGARFGRFAARV